MASNLESSSDQVLTTHLRNWAKKSSDQNVRDFSLSLWHSTNQPTHWTCTTGTWFCHPAQIWTGLCHLEYLGKTNNKMTTFLAGWKHNFLFWSNQLSWTISPLSRQQSSNWATKARPSHSTTDRPGDNIDDNRSWIVRKYFLTTYSKPSTWRVLRDSSIKWDRGGEDWEGWGWSRNLFSSLRLTSWRQKYRWNQMKF